MEADKHSGQATSSNFSTMGKAGVSITSEESRFSKTAAVERSNNPERHGSSSDGTGIPVGPGPGAAPDPPIRGNCSWMWGTASPRPSAEANVPGDYQPAP